MVIVREQVFVGGKSFDNRGGSIVDFLFANEMSRNALLVEIKTPTAPLVNLSHEYRNRVYGPTTELSSAVQQLLHARQVLQEDYTSLVRRSSGDAGFNIFATRALLIIGRMLDGSNDDALRSFEIYRNAQRGIDIVTFDEVLAKARLLLAAFTTE